MATHEGPVQIRRSSWGLTVLCPQGHVVTARENGPRMGGSDFLARVVAHQSGQRVWRVTCDGRGEPSMSTVPTIRPYATRDEWRRDFQVEPSAPDVWDVLDRETGKYLATRVLYERVVVGAREVAYNRRTGEVVYGGGVQS
jgi:hypothetical protein